MPLPFLLVMLVEGAVWFCAGRHSQTGSTCTWGGADAPTAGHHSWSPQQSGRAANVREVEGNEPFSRGCRCPVSELLPKGTRQRYFFFSYASGICLSLLYLQTVSFKLLLSTTSVVFSCIITPSLSFAG